MILIKYYQATGKEIVSWKPIIHLAKKLNNLILSINWKKHDIFKSKVTSALSHTNSKRFVVQSLMSKNIQIQVIKMLKTTETWMIWRYEIYGWNIEVS